MHNKTLKELLPKIMDHINYKYEPSIDLAREQLNMYSGDVKTAVETSIRKEILSPKSLSVMLERMVPINLLKQTTDKMSQAYQAHVKRSSNDERDQEIVDWYSKEMGLNTSLTFSNKMLNLHNYVGLEPYLDAYNKPKLRVLDASRYIPYSNDIHNPNEPTVAIKWMYNDNKLTPKYNKKGKVIDGQDYIRSVKVFYIYSDYEFLIVDGDGEIRIDLMEQAGNPEGIHNLGMLPIVHVNTSNYELVPLQDTSKKDITVSVSKMLTDLSFATLYQSHSMFYGIDVDVKNLDSNPDAFLDIKSDMSDPQNSKSPQIGILQPRVNIEDTLKLIEAEVSLHLKSLGLSVGSGSTSVNADRVASGVAKMIDEAGAEAINKEQRHIYKSVEENKLWKLIGKMHNAWVSDNKLEYGFLASEELDVTVEFSDKKPSESETAVVERIAKKLDAGLTSRRRAIQEANPHLSTEEVESLLQEIVQESSIDMSNLISGDDE